MKDDITPLLLAIQRLRNATNTIKINSPYRSPLMQLKYKEAAKAYGLNSQHLVIHKGTGCGMTELQNDLFI